MPVPLKMPQLGLTMTEGKITRWLKQEGDTVEADEAVLEIETDKINAEVEAPASGRLTHVQAQAGDSVKVIGLLALIAAPEDTDADLAAAVEAANAAAERGTAASQAVATAQTTRRPPPRARPQRPRPAGTPGRGRRARDGLAGCPPPGTRAASGSQHRHRHWSAGPDRGERCPRCG